MTFKHCYDYIKDRTQPMPLRRYLAYHTLPAALQYEDRIRKRFGGVPALYATLNTEVTPTEWVPHIKSGTRVRVVMASRLGDVGVTRDLGANHGYEVRVPVEVLKDFSTEADNATS